MDKRRLSELLDHSGCPLLALALVVKPDEFGGHQRVVLKPERPQAVELPQLSRSESISRKAGSGSLTRTTPIPEKVHPQRTSHHDR
jgi:hypothetical protein